MASVRKRKWTHKGAEKEAWVVAYVDRGAKRRQETFEKKKDADRRRQKIEEEINAGLHVADSDTITVNDACDQFLRDADRRLKIADRMTVTTLHTYLNSCRHIRDGLGAKKLNALTPGEIEDWVGELCERFKRRSVEMHAGVLNRILSFAFRRKQVGQNVMMDGKVRIPDRPKERVAIPSRDEIKALFAAMSERCPEGKKRWNHLAYRNRRAFIPLALFCGLRRGEICGLDWRNIDFDGRQIEIVTSYSRQNGLKRPKTHAGIRKIPMPPIVAAALGELREFHGKPEHGAIFQTEGQQRLPPVELWTQWRAVATRAGLADDKGKLRYHFHALRHAAVSLLIAEGLTPVHISRFVGHAQVSTTLNVYAHLFPDDNAIGRSVEAIAESLLPQHSGNMRPQLIENKTL